MGKLEAGQLPVSILRDLFVEHICLSLVALALEMGAENREADS